MNKDLSTGHMLYNLWWMMKTIEKEFYTREDLVNQLSTCIANNIKHDRFHDTQVLFQKTINKIDFLLEQGVLHGGFTIVQN
jgi:hypothetical protein